MKEVRPGEPGIFTRRQLLIFGGGGAASLLLGACEQNAPATPVESATPQPLPERVTAAKLVAKVRAGIKTEGSTTLQRTEWLDDAGNPASRAEFSDSTQVDRYATIEGNKIYHLDVYTSLKSDNPSHPENKAENPNRIDVYETCLATPNPSKKQACDVGIKYILIDTSANPIYAGFPGDVDTYKLQAQPGWNLTVDGDISAEIQTANVAANRALGLADTN